jgi:hypothetical protein
MAPLILLVCGKEVAGAMPAARWRQPFRVTVTLGFRLTRVSAVCALLRYNLQVMLTTMPWEVEHTDEFEEWWDSISEEEQEYVALAVEKLEERGPSLARPLADTL